MKREIYIILALLFFCLMGRTQINTHELLEDRIEFAVENSETEIDIQTLIDLWEALLVNPININNASFDDLMSLNLLDESQILNILNFRNTNGEFYSIYELAAIEGISNLDAQRIEPFIQFVTGNNLSEVSTRTKREIITRGIRILEQSDGLKENTYEGSPEKYYLRAKQLSQKLDLNFTAEKDVGESFFSKSNNSGFDFYSFSSRIRFKNNLNIYIGDYSVRAGQGLTIWQGFATGKSSSVGNVYKGNEGISSYTSTNENLFFRGFASSYQFKKSNLYLYYSNRSFDGNISEEDENVFTSFQSSGFHRTVGEIADKNSVKECTVGFIYSTTLNRFKIGISGIYSAFDKKLKLADRLSNSFLFQGKQIGNVGINYRYSFAKTFLFGEVAKSNNGWATIHGALLTPIDKLELSLCYRNIERNYNSLYGQAFTESSRLNDEKGLYCGFKMLPVKNISFSAYFDIFKHDWLKYTTASPSYGTEVFLQLDYHQSDRFKSYLRFFSEEKEVVKSDNALKYNLLRDVKRLRLNLEFAVNENFKLRSRIENSFYRIDTLEKGILLAQDFKYTSQNKLLTCYVRFAWFDTDSYNTRIYAYENDMLYNYSVPALFGKGVRSYLNLKYKLAKNIELWFKLARTQYFEANSMGSGNDEIDGDKKTELKIQMRYRF